MKQYVLERDAGWGLRPLLASMRWGWAGEYQGHRIFRVKSRRPHLSLATGRARQTAWKRGREAERGASVTHSWLWRWARAENQRTTARENKNVRVPRRAMYHYAATWRPWWPWRHSAVIKNRQVQIFYWGWNFAQWEATMGTSKSMISWTTNCYFSVLPSHPPPCPPSPRWAPCHSLLTCRDKQDARAEDDVVAWLVELAGGDAQASHEEQDHAQDGEDTGGPYSTWTHVEEKNDYHNYHPRTWAKNMTLELWNPISLGSRWRQSDVEVRCCCFEIGNKSSRFSRLSSFSIYIRYLSSVMQSLSLSSPPLLSVCPSAVCLFALCVWLICWLASGSPWRCSGHWAWCGLWDHQCQITELLIDSMITAYIPTAQLKRLT